MFVIASTAAVGRWRTKTLAELAPCLELDP
jgi:hypothetical protein